MATAAYRDCGELAMSIIISMVKIPRDELMQALEDAEGLYNPGFCLACGERTAGCEPDARNYECDSCGGRQVFSAAEVLLMGAYK